MGHYIACRRYGVSATLPYFLPSPWYPIAFPAVWIPLSFVGTLGAVIRIRSPIPNRKALFDIGLAGPVAGFVVCIPVLVLGLLEAEIRPTDAEALGISLGEPLLFQWMSWLVVGEVPDNFTMYLGPLGLAAWFGLFITALNLIPIGQLDGGHVTYAWLGPRALAISRAGSWICLALTYFGPTGSCGGCCYGCSGGATPPRSTIPTRSTVLAWSGPTSASRSSSSVSSPTRSSGRGRTSRRQWAGLGQATASHRSTENTEERDASSSRSRSVGHPPQARARGPLGDRRATARDRSGWRRIG